MTYEYMMYNDVVSDDEDKVVVNISFEEMEVGQCVEVYWSGEHTWFEGEITNISSEDKQFEVLYDLDKQQLWHKDEDYPVRMSC